MVSKICVTGVLVFACFSCATETSPLDLQAGKDATLSLLDLNGTPVVLQQQATVQVGAAAPKAVKGGETQYLNEPALFRAEGFYPMFVIPVGEKKTPVKIKMVPLIKGAKDDRVESGTDLNRLLSDVLGVQQLISEKKANDARTSLGQLSETWGNLVFFDYLKASTYIVDRDYAQALQVVNAALEKDGGNAELKSLQSTLKGLSPEAAK
jgi:hypothetical protein